MINRERRRERYLRDPLPIRLGGLAASLARIASSARHETGVTAVANMIEECRWFIEWTAAEAEPEVASELVDIQRILTLWRGAWPEAQQQQKQRTLLSVQAKKWADQVLDYSGLLERG
ncbi:MAG: hypothetical protein R3E79_19805 [Caldilineaceae bacterium]